MSSTEQVTEAIWRRIQNASKIEDLQSLLQEIRQCDSEGGIDPGDALALAHSALHAASQLLRDDLTAALPLIEEFLIPLCVKPQVEESLQYKVASSNLRELLADWIDQYSSSDRTAFRDTILDALCRVITDAPTREAIWTVGVIGYRGDRVLEALWGVAHNTGELGDSAITTLAALGLSGELRTRLVKVFREKIRGGLRPGLFYALQELAGPEVLELLLSLVSDANVHATLPRDVPLLFLIGVLSKVADRVPAERALPDRVWRAIRVHQKEAMSSAEIAGRCDTAETVIDYGRWLIQAGTSGAPPVARYIEYERLADLVRPNQMSGWNHLPQSQLLPILREDACANTHLTGEFVTTHVRLKVEAFETALALGSQEPLSWLDDAVGRESNLHVQQMVLNVAASLRFERLPAYVKSLIRDEFNASSEAVDQLVARAGAIRLAHSAGTREAFDLLLASGFTFGGSVLISTADALADLALARVDAGDSDVPRRLLDQALRGPAPRHREMAVNALYVLAMRNKLDPTLAGRLITVLDVQDLKETTRCRGIEALGFLPPDDSGIVDAFLIPLTSVGGNVGFRAIEALIRRGHRNKLSDDIVRNRIGVRELGGSWSFGNQEKINGWQGFLVGLLYQFEPSRFAPAVAEILRRSSSDVVFRILTSVAHHGPNSLPTIADALVERIYERFRRNFVETSLFDVLARISPNRLVSENWADVWNTWLPEGRAALCDATRNAPLPSRDPRTITMLTNLSFDSSFAVRRAAFRALATVDADVLASNCRSWARSDNSETRQRAAEAAAWLPSETVDDDGIEQIGLAKDRERSVRKIAEEILPARRRRDWARLYLQRILSVCNGENREILSAYRFGRALQKVGDDDTQRRIRERIARADLPPNAVHWLNRIAKGVSDRWKQETRKWPQPWLASEGQIEELEGTIILENAVSHQAKFSLWCRWATGPSEFNEWGAVIYPTSVESWSPLFKPGYVQIVIPGRVTARAIIGEQNASSNPARRVMAVHGTGPYPNIIANSEDG